MGNVPEAYKLNVPEMENTKLTISEDMPIVKWWGETAKSAGLSQDQYDNGVKAFIDNAVANLPNPEIEKQKLGDAGKERIEAASMWSKKHLSPEGYSTIADLANTANGVKVIEELIILLGSDIEYSQNCEVIISDKNVDKNDDYLIKNTIKSFGPEEELKLFKFGCQLIYFQEWVQ